MYRDSGENELTGRKSQELSKPLDIKDTEVRPLGEMIASVVMEFESAGKIKTPDDYPDRVAYLRGVQNNLLVTVRKRLPEADHYGRPLNTHKTGYFVEVAQINDKGTPEFGLSDINLLGQGNYQRVEVTDQPNDPIGSEGLTPTQFPYTFRRRMEERMSRAPKALPTSEEQLSGPLSGLFANIRIRNVQEESRGQETASAKKEIGEQFFYPNSNQGFSKEIQNAALVISGDPEDSDFFQAFREVGLKPYRLTPKEVIATPSDPSASIFKNFQKQHGMYPLVIVLDSHSVSQETESVARYQAIRYSEAHPMFSFIARGDSKYATSTSRNGYGWYEMHGLDIDATKRLLLKIGVDFALTTETRRVASALS